MNLKDMQRIAAAAPQAWEGYANPQGSGMGACGPWFSWEIHGEQADDLAQQAAEFIATFNPELVAKLLRVAELSPKRCICHVASCDGYHGTTHSSWCDDFRAAWDSLEGSSSTPDPADPTAD